MDLHLRPMSSEEFDAYRARSIKGYAAAHVQAGDWTGEAAEQLAVRETDALLPDGVNTPGMLLLVAENERDGIVGSAWVSVASSDKAGAWIYDIDTMVGSRGKGYGRALLKAIEQIAADHGMATIGLNVFADNQVARGLYDTSGYEATSLQMRKTLDTPS
ncbi:MAG TPA: GNAT family N-acetyltransferase [Solirubrobacteraceae bacterium]